MDKKMFCYQCEQTVGCTGCTGNAGVCGKKAGTAKLQDELTGALIGLARAVDSAAAISKSTSQIIIEGLFTTVTNVSFDDAAIENMIQKVRAEKERLVPGCSKCQSPCGKSDEYDMQQLWNADEDIRSLKSLILFGIRGMAAYAYHANVLNYEDAEVNRFFCEALLVAADAEGLSPFPVHAVFLPSRRGQPSEDDRRVTAQIFLVRTVRMFGCSDSVPITST